MTIDIKAMLYRVVAEVFDETFAVTTVSSSDDAWLHGVQVSRRADNGRAAIIRASYEWMDAFVPELEVQVTLFDYDDVEAEKEAELRRLCLVMRAYLHGEGCIERRRRLFRRGTVPALRVEVDGLEWRLGRLFLGALPIELSRPVRRPRPASGPERQTLLELRLGCPIAVALLGHAWRAGRWSARRCIGCPGG